MSSRVERQGDTDDLPRRKKKKQRGARWPLMVLLGCGGLSVVACVTVGGVAAILLGMQSSNPARPPNPSIQRMPGLIAYWSFDEVEGTKIIDHSGRNNHLTLIGGSIAGGVRGRGLSLNGQDNQYAEIPAGADFNFGANAPFTFSGWFKTVQDRACVLSMTSSKGTQQIDMLIRDNKFICVVGDDGDFDNKGNAWVWSHVRNDGGWHHFALTRTNAEIALWIDGNPQGSMGAPKSGGPVTTDLRAVGSERAWITKNDGRWGNPSFEGVIDEVAVFNRALTPGEIQTLFQH
jgi:Concanavalin A-like lectin/glucanases superfamily